MNNPVKKVDGLKTYIVSTLLALHGGYGMTQPAATWESPVQSDPTGEVLTGAGLASIRHAIGKKKADESKG